MSKYIVFILIFLASYLVRANDFELRYRCLSNCLNVIENNRHLYDVVLFNIHNSIQQRLKQSGVSIDDFNSVNRNRHRVVDFLLENDETSDLVSARRELIEVYKKLNQDCQRKQSDVKPEIVESMLPDRTLINGENLFDIQTILRSDDYKYKLEHSISNGLGVGMNDIEYNPSDMSYVVRISEDGKVLLNERSIKKLKEKLRLKRLAGIEITPSELEKERHALKPARFIYQGTLNVLDQPSDCQRVSRDFEEESYCPKGLTTFLKLTDVETGEIKEVSQKSLQVRPFYISGNIRGKTSDHISRGNLSQINSTLRLIEGSVCNNRNEMQETISKKSGFSFNIPCMDAVNFPMPVPIPNY